MGISWCAGCRGVHELGQPCVPQTGAAPVCSHCGGGHASGDPRTFYPIQTGNPCCPHCDIHTELMREVLTVLLQIRDHRSVAINRAVPEIGAEGTE